ncbi:ShiF [Klebsiella pneumoniae]|uniref:ShiF n=1 Tax=Klebsiella pneumoniae TaxID=573 RepID=A0A2X3CBX0_KLEPN|nr:ShiF [Klebsiella pneumoniae]
MPQKTLSCWPLAFSAGLLGVGQNGLLVAIPVLVIQTNLSLSIWAALLMLGSMLFLPSSPWWGKQIARIGSKPVVLWALGGYGASFTLLGLGSMLMATGAVTTAVGLGILIIARIAYGLTVSAMVPACQVWALQRAGEGNSMVALATISSGLSCGRLFGPLCAAAMLGNSPPGADGAADGSATAGAGDAAAVAWHVTAAYSGAQERQPEAGLPALICFARCY